MQWEWGLKTFAAKQYPPGIMLYFVMEAPDIFISTTIINLCQVHTHFYMFFHKDVIVTRSFHGNISYWKPQFLEVLNANASVIGVI